MISVVLATYNGERFLEEQLETIMGQSLKPDEVIISDDCSNDKTVVIIKGFIEKNKLINWKLFTRSANVGFQVNFMEMMEKVSGDLIFFADQDDIWYSSKIEEMAEIMEKDKRIMSLSCRFEMIDSKGQKIGVDKSNKWDNKVERILFEDFLSIWEYPGMAMAVRRSFLESFIDKLPDYYIAHDWAINLVASAKDLMYCYNKVLVKYRQHQNNVIGIKQKEGKVTIEDRIKFIDKAILHYDKAIEILEILNAGDMEHSIRFLRKKKKCYEKRREILCNRRVWMSLWMISWIKYYPSLRVFLSDIIFLLK